MKKKPAIDDVDRIDGINRVDGTVALEGLHKVDGINDLDDFLKVNGSDGHDGFPKIDSINGPDAFLKVDVIDGPDLFTRVGTLDEIGIDKHSSTAEYEMLKAIFIKLKSIDNNQIIALPDKHGLHFVQINHIMHCRSDNSYTEFYIDNQTPECDSPVKIVVSRGFDEFEKFLSCKGLFFRIHNQHLVNIRYINKYVKDDGNYILLNDKHQTKIPVARARRLQFLQFLKSEGFLI